MALMSSRISGLPGTWAGPLSPPFSMPARLVRSRLPLCFSPPWHLWQTSARTGRIFFSKNSVPSESGAAARTPDKDGKITRVSRTKLAERAWKLLIFFQILPNICHKLPKSVIARPPSDLASLGVQLGDPFAVAVVKLGRAGLAGAKHALSGLAPARVGDVGVYIGREIIFMRR